MSAQRYLCKWVFLVTSVLCCKVVLPFTHFTLWRGSVANAPLLFAFLSLSLDSSLFCVFKWGLCETLDKRLLSLPKKSHVVHWHSLDSSLWYSFLHACHVSWNTHISALHPEFWSILNGSYEFVFVSERKELVSIKDKSLFQCFLAIYYICCINREEVGQYEVF